MPIRTDNNADCPHCVLAETILKWRESEGGKAFLKLNRDKHGDLIANYSDIAVMNFGIARALGMILTDLQDEVEGNNFRKAMVDEFTASAMDKAHYYSNLYNARKGAH